MQKLLTIVVPVYKVEPYINKCLDSCILADEKLMSQLEVIIVNDGTPDNSAEMSREYVKRYPNTFRQIDKENGGHGSAWNVGLKEATGKYLRFLDSDDWLTNLDKLMEKLATCDADLVFTNECVHYFDGDKEIGTEVQPCSNIYDKRISVDDMDWLNVLPDNTCVNFRKCTYNTAQLQKQYPLFREKVSYDDTILYAAPCLYAKSMIAYDFPVYNLLRGRDEQSMNPQVMKKKAEQIVQSYLDLHSYITRNEFHQNVLPLVESIDNSSYGYCFGIVSHLEYARRKKLCQVMLENQPLKKDYNKLVKRYMQWPFLAAYIWDNVRYLKESLEEK